MNVSFRHQLIVQERNQSAQARFAELAGGWLGLKRRSDDADQEYVQEQFDYYTFTCFQII